MVSPLHTTELLRIYYCLTYSYANANSAGETLRPENLHAHITVIPKPGKDPSSCGSYHPISLLNIDAKLYAKVIANRLLPLLPQWVSADQTGFIPGREARDNALRTLSLLAYTRGSPQPTFLLSTDAEKAFDRVDWGYLMATLSHLGIGPSLLMAPAKAAHSRLFYLPFPWNLFSQRSDITPAYMESP